MAVVALRWPGAHYVQAGSASACTPASCLSHATASHTLLLTSLASGGSSKAHQQVILMLKVPAMGTGLVWLEAAATKATTVAHLFSLRRLQLLSLIRVRIHGETGKVCSKLLGRLHYVKDALTTQPAT